jgi:tetratricopeptide (TPR) repeat protein
VRPVPQKTARMVLAVGLGVVTIGVALYIGLTGWWRVEAARRLPGIPDLTGQPAAVIEHITHADQAARAAPSDAETVGALAMAYHADLLYEPAIAAYARATELDRSNWRWTYLRALVFAERGDAARAGDTLRTVVTTHPELAMAWWRLGESAFKRARYDEADAAYARAESAFSVSDDGGVRSYAMVGRARVALMRGDAATSERQLRAVIADNPRFTPAHRVLSEVLRSQGRLADAEHETARAQGLKAYSAPHDPMLDALGEVSRSSVFLLRQAAAGSSKFKVQSSRFKVKVQKL